MNELIQAVKKLTQVTEDLMKQLGDLSHQIFMCQQQYLLDQKYLQESVGNLDIEAIKTNSGLSQLLYKENPSKFKRKEVWKR